MASFVGTNAEFRRFIGPRLRNLIQQITKKHKIAVSACEHCASVNNLESAHVHGRGRNEIIDLVLKDYTFEGVVTVDIGKFEQQFIEEHHPFEKSFLILCNRCHREYDSKIKTPQRAIEVQPSLNQELDDCLPITLDPSNPDDFKQKLLVTKKAVIEIHFANGNVETRSWNASRFNNSSNLFGNLRSRPDFRAGRWQKEGIVKVHVIIPLSQ